MLYESGGKSSFLTLFITNSFNQLPIVGQYMGPFDR